MANEKRLIDANALLEKAYWRGERATVYNPYPIGEEVVNVSDIENALTVDAVEVVHAQWEVECRDRKKCSNCGHGRNTETQLGWNYCPNCGARMDGDSNG